MSLIDRLKQQIGPQIICPGATPEQIAAFLRRNTIIGGRVTLGDPTQLEGISGQLILAGEITAVRDRISISGNISIGKNKIIIR